jgi:hypothetical protein
MLMYGISTRLQTQTLGDPFAIDAVRASVLGTAPAVTVIVAVACTLKRAITARGALTPYVTYTAVHCALLGLIFWLVKPSGC